MCMFHFLNNGSVFATERLLGAVSVNIKVDSEKDGRWDCEVPEWFAIQDAA